MTIPWRIEMLGGLAIVQGDRRIARFQTQKTGALLAYLALHPGKNHSRESLAEMLWPEGDPVAIRNRLNQAISSLRRQLHPPGQGQGNVLVADHYTIGLNAGIVSSDVEQFEKEIRAAERATDDAAKIGLLESAVALYKGELLEGYYEDWIFGSRIHLADLYEKALQQLIRSHVALGSLDSAIDFARKRLELDPFDEAPHVVLMRLYLRAGRPKFALKQFEDLERALKQFDDEPSEKALLYKSRADAASHDVALEGDPDFEIDGPSTGRESALPKVQDRAEPNLPRLVNSFVGRSRELDFATSALRGDAALVSILGLGGAGKSRLATEVGWALADHFEGRVHFVPLANARVPGDLWTETARVLLPSEPGLADPESAIVEHLRNSPPTLLILDNFEHFAKAGAPLISALLDRAPTLKVLATSRLPLNLSEELQIHLAPLPLPRVDSKNLSDLAENASIALFVDRAQQVKSDFQLTERTSETISELCRKLEGLPLAIELAASWARVLTPSQMLAQVESNLDQLESRKQDVNPRHRTIRAAFDGTYELLGEEQRAVLTMLGVFPDSWEIEGAKFVTGRADVIDVLLELEDVSLISTVDAANSMRFSMLGTVRHFCRSLMSEGDLAECEARHAEFYSQLIVDNQSDDWIAKVEEDYVNAVAAMRWTRHHGSPDDFGRLVGKMVRFWENQAMLFEGRDWVAEARDLSGKMAPLTAARIRCSYAFAEWLLGRFDTAMQELEGVAEVFRQEQAPVDEIQLLFLRQLEAHRVGDYPAAEEHLRQVLNLASEAGVGWAAARAWLALGNASVEQNRFDEAASHFEKSLLLARESGERDHIVSALANLANLAVHRGRLDSAKKWITEAASLIGPHDRRWRTAMTKVVKARVENALDDHQEALMSALKAYRMSPGRNVVVWRVLLQLGIAQAGLGWKRRAAQTFGFLEKYREMSGETHHGVEMGEYERHLSSLRDNMPEAEFKEQVEFGRNMMLESVIAQANRF